MKKLIIISIAVIALTPIAGKSSSMEIKITGGFVSGISGVEITDGKNKGVQVHAVEGNGSETKLCSGTTDKDGKYSKDSIDKGLSTNTENLKVLIGSETWLGITTDGKYDSEEQKKAANQKVEIQSLMFDSFGSIFSYEDGLYAQVQVINQDTQYAYEFPSLVIYDDLDELYFNTDAFDSQEAINTGQLVSDVISEMGKAGVTKMGDGGNIITVPSGIINNPERYVLLKGTAHKIDDEGNPVGPDIDFGIAIVPEPATICLLAIGAMTVLRKK